MLDLAVRDIVEFALIGGGWLATIVKIDSRLKSVERDIKEVISLTKWRERMETEAQYIRRDLDELRRGRGWIQNGEAKLPDP